MRVAEELRAHEAAGSLAEELPYWGWLDDDRTCLTRSGELIAAGRLRPAAVDGRTPGQVDRVLGLWQRLLSGLGPGARLYFHLLRRPTAIDWRLALSELEAERSHLRLDGEPVILYSLLSPPGQAHANLLRDLYCLDATMTVSLEWRPWTVEAARRRIRGAQRHYFSRRYSMMAHVQETEGTASAMVDSAAAVESDRLGGALVELEADAWPTAKRRSPWRSTEGLRISSGWTATCGGCSPRTTRRRSGRATASCPSGSRGCPPSRRGGR